MTEISSGVYTIINKINNKIYVGSTKNFKSRVKSHKQLLEKGYKFNLTKSECTHSRGESHFNKRLQEDFNYYFSKYGDNIWNDVYEFNLDIKVSPIYCTMKNISSLEDALISSINKAGIGFGQNTNEHNSKKYGFGLNHKSDHNFEILCINIDKIKDMYYNKCMSFQKIADIYNCSKGDISRLFNTYGLEVKDMSYIKLGFKIEDYKENIIEDYNDKNITSQQISDKYNISRQTLTDMLRKWGIKENNFNDCKINLTEEKSEIIKMRINDKMSLEKIGKHYGVSRSTIRRHFEKWNVEYKI